VSVTASARASPVAGPRRPPTFLVMSFSSSRSRNLAGAA
jgi:hypothetical protein